MESSIAWGLAKGGGTAGIYSLQSALKYSIIVRDLGRAAVPFAAVSIQITEVQQMKKLFVWMLSALTVAVMFLVNVSAATTHTVVSGYTMWKIAVRYQVGLSEIKSANPQISNPDLIYPGQVLNIPTTDTAVTSYEKEVVRLVNEIRVQNGLK